LGSDRQRKQSRAEKAHDRASGRPDPPFPSGPPSSRSEASRRRAGRPRGRRTCPHGFARVPRGSSAERSAVLVWRSRQAVSAAFRYSLPHRGSKAVALDHASLNLARPFRARTGGSTSIEWDRLHPPRLPAPSAHAAPRIRSTRACRARHLPSSAFRTLSTACTPRHLPGLFHPGGAHGVPVFRALFLAGGQRLLSKPLALLPFRSDLRASLNGGRIRGLQSFHLPGESASWVAETHPTGDALLTFSPLRLSQPPR
jgi:hypothetical protein